jgi:hypothetical protein
MPITMATTTLAIIARAINVSSADVPDAKVLKMIKRAEEGKVSITVKKQGKKCMQSNGSN